MEQLVWECLFRFKSAQFACAIVSLSVSVGSRNNDRLGQLSRRRIYRVHTG